LLVCLLLTAGAASAARVQWIICHSHRPSRSAVTLVLSAMLNGLQPAARHSIQEFLLSRIEVCRGRSVDSHFSLQPHEEVLRVSGGLLLRSTQVIRYSRRASHACAPSALSTTWRLAHSSVVQMLFSFFIQSLKSIASCDTAWVRSVVSQMSCRDAAHGRWGCAVPLPCVLLCTNKQTNALPIQCEGTAIRKQRCACALQARYNGLWHDQFKNRACAIPQPKCRSPIQSYCRTNDQRRAG
jgi:hypothetical protein